VAGRRGDEERLDVVEVHVDGPEGDAGGVGYLARRRPQVAPLDQGEERIDDR
jgi:hypothetical protein